jgi:Methane oxygenase PmoA
MLPRRFIRQTCHSILRLLLCGACVWAFANLNSRGAPAEGSPLTAPMQAKVDPGTGQVDITDAGQPVLRYNYRTKEPGDLLNQVHPDNRKYARARSDYIHPLYGPNGEELTRDWSVDHPHHRGIYWAWPEVDYHGERGDLHALQRVFARPTGRCLLQSGADFAQIDAENDWLWDDREPIVRERAIIRAFKAGAGGRCVDLEFHLTALADDVAIARRGTDQYGGLNIRLVTVQNQQITTYTDPPKGNPRMAWATLRGMFAAGKPAVALTILQHPDNPDYPGDWIKFPELNWLQPTFPAGGQRYVLNQGQPLVLRYRLWIHGAFPNSSTPQLLNSQTSRPEPSADEWRAYKATSRIMQ